MDGINTLRYSDLFLAMYFDGGKSCLHRNHSHVLVYVYSGEMVIDEKGQITRLHKGECAFIRKDFSVQMTEQAWNGEQFKAIFLMFTMKFLRDFYSKLDRNTLPKDAKRDQVSLYKLPSNRPDIVSLFESMTPYFNSRSTDRRIAATKNGRGRLCVAQYRQESICLYLRFYRSMEDRHTGIHGAELYERYFHGRNRQLYGTQSLHI